MPCGRQSFDGSLVRLKVGSVGFELVTGPWVESFHPNGFALGNQLFWFWNGPDAPLFHGVGFGPNAVPCCAWVGLVVFEPGTPAWP